MPRRHAARVSHRRPTSQQIVRAESTAGRDRYVEGSARLPRRFRRRSKTLGPVSSIDLAPMARQRRALRPPPRATSSRDRGAIRDLPAGTQSRRSIVPRSSNSKEESPSRGRTEGWSTPFRHSMSISQRLGTRRRNRTGEVSSTSMMLVNPMCSTPAAAASVDDVRMLSDDIGPGAVTGEEQSRCALEGLSPKDWSQWTILNVPHSVPRAPHFRRSWPWPTTGVSPPRVESRRRAAPPIVSCCPSHEQHRSRSS